MKVVLNSKIILANNLTYEQAADLMGAISSRKELENVVNNRVVWMSNNKPRFEDDKQIWYVYLIDETLLKAFLASPENFIFEI